MSFDHSLQIYINPMFYVLSLLFVYVACVCACKHI